ELGERPAVAVDQLRAEHVGAAERQIPGTHHQREPEALASARRRAHRQIHQRQLRARDREAAERVNERRAFAAVAQVEERAESVVELISVTSARPAFSITAVLRVAVGRSVSTKYVAIVSTISSPAAMPAIQPNAIVARYPPSRPLPTDTALCSVWRIDVIRPE